MPRHLSRRWAIALAEDLQLFRPGRQRRGDVGKSRRRLLERLALQIDDAPAPFGDPRPCEREDVHDVLCWAAAPGQTTGGPWMTSNRAAASERMIGHDGSNSERRTLNFGERGWA